MDTSKYASAIRDSISKQIDAAVRQAQAEERQLFIEYLGCRISGNIVSPDKITPATVASYDRQLQLLKQEWAKKHGIVPVAEPAKANG